MPRTNIPMPRLQHKFTVDMFIQSPKLNDLIKNLITDCEIDYFNKTFKVNIVDPFDNSELLHNALFNEFVIGENVSFSTSKHFIYISDYNGECFVTLKVKPLSHKIRYDYRSDSRQAVHECLFEIYEIDAVS